MQYAYVEIEGLSATLAAQPRRTIVRPNAAPFDITRNIQSGRYTCIELVKKILGIETSVGSAKNWWENADRLGFARSATPAVRTVLIQSVDSGFYKNTGHAAVVMKVEKERIFIREANYGCDGCIGERWVQRNDPTIRGYLYRKT